MKCTWISLVSLGAFCLFLAGVKYKLNKIYLCYRHNNVLNVIVTLRFGN